MTGARGGQTSPNLGIHIGLPLIAPGNFEDLAAKYEKQDPAAYIPEGSDPTIIAGYSAFQKLHAKHMRKKNVNFLSHALGSGSPGGYAVNLHTLSHGCININPKDPEAEPLVDYRALTNPMDIDVMIALVRYIRSFIFSEALAEYNPREVSPGAHVQSDEDLAEWIRKTYIPTVYHPVGSAAKMPLELGGVVSEELVVYGTKNLRIVDASIMPTVPGAPTSQTVYMIAEKVGCSATGVSGLSDC
jgi:choline dehydrogenase-like flavoprotein